MVDVKYKARASATGGRDGHSRSDDGKVDVKLSVPKELGGPGGDGTNPEQLFASGYAACFLGAVKFAAGKQQVKVPDDAKVTAIVGIGPIANGFGLDIDLEVSLPGVDRTKAEALVKQAHEEVCPYSNATRGNVDVRVKLV
jgi:Ohr subfamily peroxiredoxin